MKKNYLFLLLCLFYIGQVSGQVRNIYDALQINKHYNSSGGMKMINDTIWPASFSGTCLDSLKLYYSDAVAPHDSGWLCGSNSWLDKEKAMKFYQGSVSVNSAIPFFGIRRGTNGTIYAKIYARDATSRGPGALLGTSNGIAMSAIDTFNQGINFRNVFRFTPAVSVTDTFFVSFTMPAFVNNSNELGLISESINCSRSYRNTAWEQWSDNTWHSFNAAYNTNIDMAIFPVISIPSTQNHILTFYLSQQTSPATINPSLHQIFVQVAYGTNVTSLSPTITVSPNATINPLSNTAQNFTNPFTYNVTAESGSVQPWVVNVSIAAPLSPANDILTFTLSQLTAAAVINSTSHTVTGQVAHGTSRTSLTPTITVSSLATINPASGTAHDFTNPFAYTVTAQDGTPQNWIVTITEVPALRGGKNILSFALPQQQSSANIDTNTHYVSITVVYGTNPSSLTPTISVSPGATINPASGVAVNFTNPVAYTLTAENGNTQPWVVNVSVATQLSSENDILAFTLSQLTAPVVINSTNHTATGQVAYGTNRTSLTPTITVSPSATINPASGTAHDFTNPFAYMVTAQDGTPQNWIVTITEASALRGGKNILSFTLPQQQSPANIDTNTHYISITVVYGTNPSSLTPTINVSPGATINPASGVAVNFTNPVAYTVTAENGNTQPWVVNVSVAPQLSSENDILTFTLSQLTAPVVINNTSHTITGQVVHATNRTNLAPTITVSPLATINPASGTAHDFSNPFVYTVTAQDGTPQNWIVTITEASALRGGKNILSFTMPQQESPANIDTNTHYVSITVVYGTNPASLTPSINVSPGATINPDSGVALNFTNPVAYTVTAENGNTQPWVVNVNVATQPSSQNDILTFTLSQLTSPAVIDNISHTVTGQVIHGTGLTNLIPTITVSAMATITPASGTAQNYTNPVAYTVTAQNGTPQNWIVTITEATSFRNGKNILSFTLPQQESPANIDTITHYVTISVVHGTDRSDLTPTITVSPGAGINPASGTSHNFINPYAYTVTAEDLTTQNWVVSVTEAIGLIDTPEILSIDVFPNPATGVIGIESYSVNYHYVLCDMYGRILMEGFTGVEKEILNISDINSGIYFFKFWKGNKVSLKKIVIQ